MLIFIKLKTFRPLIRMHVKYNSNSTTLPNLVNASKTMPKEPKHIAETQKQRKKLKEKYSKCVPGRVALQVLGTGAPGAPSSLYMFSDQARYLFNCGEGTQRLAHEHKMKLAKLEHIFITQPVWRNIGGLPGTALTIQDVGVPEITLHGPQGTEELFTATKRFVIIRDLKIKMADCNENTSYEDNTMTVQYVPLTKSTSLFNDDEEVEEQNLDLSSKEVQVGSNGMPSDASTSTRSDRKSRRSSRPRKVSQSMEMVEDDTDYYAHERKRRRNRHRSRSRTVSGGRTSPSNISQTSRLLLEDIKEKGISMAFICKLQPRPGALLLEKCVDCGVPPGPLLGKLKSGEDVTLEDGTVVRSVDVCEPNDPGPVFIVVDCPSEDYLDSLVNNETFKRHQATANCEDDVATLVVHFTPKIVMANPRYREWVNRFSPSTQHLVMNDANTCLGSIAVHRIQYKLNLLHDHIFPLLEDGGTDICENDECLGLPIIKKMKSDFCDKSSNGNGSNFPLMENLDAKLRSGLSEEGFVFGNTLCSFHLRPKRGLDRSAELKLIPSEYLKETLSVQGFSDALQELKQKLSIKSKDLTIRPYPKILFLGTGSCIPNKTRNTSGILLQTSDNSYTLLDCGEGTFGQLIRFFGRDKTNDVLSKINAVYISHLHADHHIGLVGLLLGRRHATKVMKRVRNPVLLFAPKQILAWLNFYDRCFENITEEFELVPNGDLLLNDEKISHGMKMRICNTLELENLNTVYVKHCPNAFGVSFTHADGYKITYSGDTMPCESLIKLGMDSDVLIHEATMEDELSHEAVIKMHSTTSQAIEVGRLMHAKNILLTHFSQRYAKLPRFNENFDDNIGIAFDNMQIRLDELPLVPLLYPALRLMFAEHYEELEHKAVKRQLRMEREREASRERQFSSEIQK